MWCRSSTSAAQPLSFSQTPGWSDILAPRPWTASRRFNVLVTCSGFYLDKKFKLQETFLVAKRLMYEASSLYIRAYAHGT